MNTSYGIIYVLTSPSGKRYVGQTTKTLKERLRGHVNTAKRLPKLFVAKAINKYGISSFDVREIAVAHSSMELDIKEDYWIKALNTMSPNGYNTREVLTGAMTPEVRKRMSESKKGHEVTVETRNKIKASLLEYHENIGTTIKHGTTTGYSHYKCRCKPCKKAHKASSIARNKKILLDVEALEHGKFKAYRAGCRCIACKAFHSNTGKEYHQKLRNGEIGTHGITAYGAGCRCVVCKEANKRNRVTRKLKLQEDLKANKFSHGIRRAYESGCRCTECSSFHKERMRRYRNKNE